jgi:hypothetical protein
MVAVIDGNAVHTLQQYGERLLLSSSSTTLFGLQPKASAEQVCPDGFKIHT